MVRNSFIEKYLGWDYSDFNHGKSGAQRKRNRRLGCHIIRSRKKQELKRELIECNIK